MPAIDFEPLSTSTSKVDFEPLDESTKASKIDFEPIAAAPKPESPTPASDKALAETPKSFGERLDAAVLPDWAKQFDVMAQRGIRRALNLPLSQPPTGQDLMESARQVPRDLLEPFKQAEAQLPDKPLVSPETVKTVRSALGGDISDKALAQLTGHPEQQQAIRDWFGNTISGFTSPQAAGAVAEFANPIGRTGNALDVILNSPELFQRAKQAYQTGDVPAALNTLMDASRALPVIHDLPKIGGELNAIERGNAQVQEGTAPFGIEARPEGEVPRPSDSNNVVGETSRKGGLARKTQEAAQPVTDRFGYKYVKKNGTWWNVDDEGNLLQSLDPNNKAHQSVIEFLERPQPVPEAGQTATVVGEKPTVGADVGAVPVTDEPHVSAIANRFVEERAARGELGQITPGRGFSREDLVQGGLTMPPEVINQHVSDLMQGTGDIVKQGQAVRAEEARLSARSNQLSRVAEANPQNMEAKMAADNAFKDLEDFHNGPVATLKQKWHATGLEMQGEIPVDLSTFNGLRQQWLRDVGEAPPAKVEPELRRAAQNVSKAIVEDNGARSKLAQAIDKEATRRKYPSADEVRNNIRERMGLEPCRI